ncbi:MULTISPECIES: hypothetical protein [unclassified Zymobacter]|uniref:hypothetical protein n=1 Tax=unclassified Zymobacter TaxID=3048685 RepID=UPI0039C0DC18
MIILFWLSFSVAIAGTFIALHGGPFTPCRVVVLSALGTAMGALVIIGSLEALLGIPLLGCAVLVVALTELDPPA